MARARVLERLSASDLFLLMWDDDGWRSDMGALAILDGSDLLDDHGRVELFAHGVRDTLDDLAARAERDPTQGLVPRHDRGKE